MPSRLQSSIPDFVTVSYSSNSKMYGILHYVIDFTVRRPHEPRPPEVEVFPNHIQLDNTVGGTPLDERSARCRDLYVTSHIILTRYRHSWPRRDSNLLFQQAVGRRPRSRPLGYWIGLMCLRSMYFPQHPFSDILRSLLFLGERDQFSYVQTRRYMKWWFCVYSCFGLWPGFLETDDCCWWQEEFHGFSLLANIFNIVLMYRCVLWWWWWWWW